MARRIRDAGGEVHVDSPVRAIAVEDGRAQGLLVGDELHPCRAVVATLPTPLLSPLIPEAYQSYGASLKTVDYLGIVCPLLVLDRPLSGFWTLNITDDTIPFTGIIETTSYIDPQYVGGHHLVYLPKYTARGSRWQHLSDEELREIWLQHLEAMFPDFDRHWIRYFVVHREPYVEPLHLLGSADSLPALETPVEHLYLATTAQIYPALTNCESVTRHAREVASTIVGSAAAAHELRGVRPSNLPVAATSNSSDYQGRDAMPGGQNGAE
jgi:protoporphyrinogen oxidase